MSVCKSSGNRGKCVYVRVQESGGNVRICKSSRVRGECVYVRKKGARGCQHWLPSVYCLPEQAELVNGSLQGVTLGFHQDTAD